MSITKFLIFTKKNPLHILAFSYHYGSLYKYIVFVWKKTCENIKNNKNFS